MYYGTNIEGTDFFAQEVVFFVFFFWRWGEERNDRILREGPTTAAAADGLPVELGGGA